MVRRCRSKECSPLNTPHRVVFAIGVTEGVGSVRELSLEWSGKYPGAVFPACGAIVRSREWIDSEQAFTRESGGAYRGSQGGRICVQLVSHLTGPTFTRESDHRMCECTAEGAARDHTGLCWSWNTVR